jgi:SAM-dependent methyltransferase
MSLRDGWEARAADWVRWARSPELDDDFWGFHLRHFLELVPSPGRLTADVACGEGRLGRVLAAQGHRVIGVDAVAAMAAAAAAHPQAHPVVVADAARLPLHDGAADLVVAFMCLHDLDELEPVVLEMARVLSQDGRLCVALLHPLVTAKLAGAYPVQGRYQHTVERGGRRMLYAGIHRPLAAYGAALEAAGLVVEAVREPVAEAADGVVSAPFLDLRVCHASTVA